MTPTDTPAPDDLRERVARALLKGMSHHHMVESALAAFRPLLDAAEARATAAERERDEARERVGRLRAALRGMLAHSGVADAGADMKDAEDHAAERRARAALGGTEGGHE